ncbi:conjugal transfer protein [Enterococcus casseliflavus]
MKKIKVKKIGLRKKTTSTLWTLLIISVAFGVYKNFTAIDQHTVHEEKVIETKVLDTNFVSSYVEEFAQVFYSWTPTKEALEQRTEELKQYLPDDLQQLNQEMIRSDIPTKATVEDIKIWGIEPLTNQDYKVLYSIKQRIEETTDSQTEIKVIKAAYSLTVRTDDESSISIVSNPAMAALPKKLKIETESLQDDLAVTAKDKEEITQFLNTFFTAYPRANKTELQYYCDVPSIEEINKEYIFSGIKSINYFTAEKAVSIHVVVDYLNTETKAAMTTAYDLLLEKRDNKWIIIDGI